VLFFNSFKDIFKNEKPSMAEEATKQVSDSESTPQLTRSMSSTASHTDLRNRLYAGGSNAGKNSRANLVNRSRPNNMGSTMSNTTTSRFRASVGKKRSGRNRMMPSKSMPALNRNAAATPTVQGTPIAPVVPQKMAWQTLERAEVPSESKDETKTSAGQTFTESLNLDQRYLEEFLAGNFIYLRPKMGLQRSSYDLECVEHFETDPNDYYTMSREGITRFSNDQSDFTSLVEWEKEYALFNSIRKIRFFDIYRVWKSFTRWKRSFRFRKMDAAAEEIQSKLAIFTPALQKTHMQLIHLCHDVTEWKLFALDDEATVSLEEFIENQTLQRTQVTEWLTGFSEDVRMLVRGACDDVLDSFLGKNEIRADHKMTFMEKAALRTECSRLVKYIRVVDMLVISTLRKLALQSCEYFRSIVSESNPCRKRKVVKVNHEEDDAALIKTHDVLKEEPMFKLTVGVNEGALSIVPSSDKFLEAVEDSISEAITIIDIPERLLTHADLAIYVTASSSGNDTVVDEDEDGNGGEDLITLITQTQDYQYCRSNILSSVSSAFDEVVEYSEIFEPYKNTYNENVSTEANMRDMFKDVPLETFKTYIEKFNAQNGKFSGIPYTADIGLIRVDSSRFKALLLPSPEAMIQNIRELLPLLMEEDGDDLLSVLEQGNGQMAAVPADASEFVAKIKQLGGIEAKMDAHMDAYKRWQDMETLFVEEEWALPDKLKDQRIMLSQAIKNLEQGIERTNATKDSDLEKFADMVKSDFGPLVQKPTRKVRESLDDPMIRDDKSKPEAVLAFIREQQSALEQAAENFERLTGYQEALEKELDEFEDLVITRSDLNAKLALWEALDNWSRKREDWEGTLMQDINSDSMDKDVQQFNKTAVKSKRLLQGAPAAIKLNNAVNDFKSLLPVILDLRNESLLDRHWKEIEEAIGHSFDEEKPASAHTLKELLDLRVQDHQEEIATVSTKAISEDALVQLFQTKVINVWKKLEFEVKPYKDTRDYFILGGLDEIQAALDESLVQVNTILGSRYCGPIREEVNHYQKQLLLLSDTLDAWLMVQKNWMYLETIFAAPDIQRQLPQEAALFKNVDKSWQNIMAKVNGYPNALVAGTHKGRKELFVAHNATLDKIQKNLEEYLETKRQAFARFYFLSDEELLEILAQTRDPHAVQPHLRKCFDNLMKLEFGEGPKKADILAMFSPKNERVPMTKNLKARGDVEGWLGDVETSMRMTLWAKMKLGVLDYVTKPRVEWLTVSGDCEKMGGHPGQVVATGAQIMWTRFVEENLQSEDPVAANDKYLKEIMQDIKDLVHAVRGKLTKLQRRTIGALVTTDVHNSDVVQRLRDEKVNRLGNFTWQMQLRYYWEKDASFRGEDCLVKMSNATFVYGYEYMGCTTRLVITPLTDRCWLCITGAGHIKRGAAPAGPAGTGKTESSKDLAKAMGLFCVVFNCSDQIDYIMIAKLFSGLAQAGCWTCLDEFNRINIEVLSVVAQMMIVLRNGMAAKKKTMVFMGRTIKLSPHIVIVTMNPGYAGRTALPDNLKVCFRPVAMLVPDYALIAEIILFSEGFDGARVLARKMVNLYKLSSEQLSQQRHYDYGLRAVISVLKMAGALKRGNPDMSEDVVLIKAMRDSNLPKFLKPDLPLFYAICGDLFPGLVVPTEDYGELMEVIVEVIGDFGLQVVNGWIKKIIQLYDMLQLRFGVSVVGPTGGGKSTCIRVLNESMTRLRRDRNSINPAFRVVKETIVNPKSVSMGELYGEYNLLTQEWKDGLASTIIRMDTNEENEEQHTITFDGPVDTLWIESLNTVLDDNCMLCLASGERMKLNRDRDRMLFEVEDLVQASPATVSRLGVVYVTPLDLLWSPYVDSWLEREIIKDIGNENSVKLREMFESKIDGGLRFVRRNCSEPIMTTDLQLVTSLCNMFNSQLKNCKMDREHGDFSKFMKNLFGYCFLWCLGGGIKDADQEKFDEFVRDHLDDINFGPTALAYGAFLDIQTGKFGKWTDIVPEFSFDIKLPYFALIVPTIDTARYGFLFKSGFDAMYPVFFTGVTGTGKTVVVQRQLNKLSLDKEDGGENVMPIVVNFSAQTSSMQTQRAIEAKLEKKRKGVFGGPSGKPLIIFVDDINMPIKDEYGSQPPIELLRQMADYSGMFDRDKVPEYKAIQDMVLMSAAAPPGGGRSEISKRFSRHFHMLCLPSASVAVLKSIFEGILGGYLVSAKFAKDTQGLTSSIVTSTIGIYHRMADELRPTPVKSHYTFNLRDVSKVFQGCLMVKSKQAPNSKTFAKAWVHETLRVFCDRLINNDDRSHFTHLVAEFIGRNFSLGWKHEDLFETELPLLWCDFLRPAMDDGTIYEEVKDIQSPRKVLIESLDDYNMTFPTQMKLVFFEDAICHICRISRVLRQPRGNAMLCGVGGSGRQSLTRMACFLGEVKAIQIELTRGYGLVDFREAIKEMMITSGGATGESVAFILVDTQIIMEGFLEDVNNVLNTGEIPSLFENDEVNKIVEELRPITTKMGIVGTRNNIWQAFVSRVRDNLHIILCMSPVGDTLRIRCRNFPALINCCTIDWFDKWPRSALSSVANEFLSEVELGSKETNAMVCEACANVHLSVNQYSDKFFEELRRKVYTSPKSFLDLINLYTGMLAIKREELGILKDRLTIGVKKLDDTNSIVLNLQQELTKKQPILVQAQKDAADLIVVVTKEKADAAIVQENVEKEEAIVGKQAGEVEVLANDAQADLDKAMPAFNNALKALATLKKDDITEIKGFANPPDAVKVVLEAVCLLLGSPTDWKSAKGVMSQSNFLQQLKDYDKDNIEPKICKKLQKYIDHPLLVVEVVAKKSLAAKSLAMWVHAMDVYSKVAKSVGPKKEMLAKLNAELDAANAALKEKQDQLAAVIAKVDALKQQLDDTLAKKQELEAEAQLTKDRLVRADKLTSGLKEEGERWRVSVGTLGDEITALIGDVFMGAACISYYGSFTGLYRVDMIDDWVSLCKTKEIPCSDNFNLAKVLGNPVEIRSWVIDGLPTDDVSVNNAILVKNGKRWPLMIDPQEQAKQWIKNMERENKLKVTKLNDPNMLRSLESCIRIGAPLLVEDIGEMLDPALEPVLQNATFVQGGRLLIRLGDSDVDYDKDFKIYFTTKLPNPHYLPEVCIKVTIINFTVTFDGLEAQLLGDVVRKERPDVEERKNNLVSSIANDKKQLDELEKKILKLLSESKGFVLDDVDLIEALGESKIVSGVVKERLKESEKTEEEINTMRMGYKPVAVRASILYFVIADMANVDPMYQYSLGYFKRLYELCLEDSKKDNNLEARLQNIIDYMTYFVFNNICRGLFEKDKLNFAFLICVQIFRNANVIEDEEWSLLLRGAGMAVAPLPNPLPSLIPPFGWNLISILEANLGDTFEGIMNAISSNADVWEDWGSHDEPQDQPLPGGWQEKLNSMQQMLLVKCFRQEKLQFSIQKYIIEKMGREYVETAAVQMTEVYKDTDYRTPVVFVLSTGADPTGLLLQLAKVRGWSERIEIISLGQGQGPVATKMIEAGCKTGGWVCLQNCHLAASWMGELEEICNMLNDSNSKLAPVHDDFRLFLTSMPTKVFPIPVLQNSVKVTTEPPRGMKANMKRSLNLVETWTDFETCEGVNGVAAWKKLAFGICFFHGIVQERRKFGPLGWNIAYEFNDSDLETAIATLKMFLEEQPVVPWDALQYVTGMITYGGRVTDDLDRRCMTTILNQYYDENIFNDEHKMSSSGIYFAPPVGPMDSFVKYIDTLPLTDAPEVFGMNANADISLQANQTRMIVETCLSLQPRKKTAAGGKTGDEIVAELAIEIENRLPKILDMENAGPTTFIKRGEHMDSLSTVLSQEMDRYNQILVVMSSSLEELQRAIRGEVLMSDELDNMYVGFTNNTVPDNWGLVAYPSLKPLASWVENLIGRVNFMQIWLENGQPKVFELPYFYFPQGFTTGCLQNHARKYQLPIDELQFKYKVRMEEGLADVSEENMPADGVLVGGLFLDGARWDRELQCLQESHKGQLYDNMPVIHFVPHIDLSKKAIWEYDNSDGAVYPCPTYKTSTRSGALSTTGMSTNYIAPIDLPTPAGKPPSFWICQGIAMLCALND
jgi:dynein heavy chain, axonemal